jgi:hypothetical protein
MHATPITLKEYYKRFKSISGVLATALGIVPILTVLIPGSASDYFFPALGDVTMLARVGVVILAGAVTFVCFYDSKPPNVPRRFLGIGAISTVALIGVLITSLQFIRKVTVPANGSAILVSVGYERTAFANQTFHDESDWDMLRARGTSDEEVYGLWTRWSVNIARLLLVACYAGFILPLVAIFSLGVRYDM